MSKFLLLFHTNPFLEVKSLQNDLLAVLTSYRDLYVTRNNIEAASPIREVAMLHVLNHVSKWVEASAHDLS